MGLCHSNANNLKPMKQSPNTQSNMIIHNSNESETFKTNETNSSTIKEENHHEIIEEKPESLVDYSTEINANINSEHVTASEYLLKSQTIHIQKVQCNLSTCSDLILLESMLLKYRSFITSNSDKKKGTFDVDILPLLNAFQHLLFMHQHEFESIHNNLVEKCNEKQYCLLKNCLLIRRNQCQTIQTVYDLYFSHDDNDIAVQQIMDTIHCYFFHSFDIGYKFTQKEKNEICNETGKDRKEDEKSDRVIAYIHQRMRARQTMCRDIPGLERITNSHKFTTQTPEFQSNETDTIYDGGIKYFYWDYYKGNECTFDPATSTNEWGYITLPANEGYKVKDWYIQPIFQHLKQELLQNEICNISHQQWNTTKIQAIKHKETRIAKGLKCIGQKSKNRHKIYGISIGDPIGVVHIIAMMVYCNYDTLQSKFSKTFRISEEYASHKLLMKAHKNYAHLGRLLREFTDCFGTTISDLLEDRLRPLYYHGVSKQVNFKSVAAYIKCPMSSSTDYAVAVNFSANQGVILEFSLSTAHFYGRDACVDCCWLSAFANEQEVFFIGGYGLIFFNSIITAGGINYCEYIKGMRALNEVFTESVTATITNEQTLAMCCRLVQHRLYKCDPTNKNAHEFKTLPKYMEKLLDNYCNSITIIVFWCIPIVMHTSATRNVVTGSFDIKTIRTWLQSIFFYDFGWANLELLMKVFPSLKEIMLRPLYFWVHDINPSHMMNNPLFGEMLLEFFKRYYPKYGILKRITIAVDEEHYGCFYQSCVAFNQKYSLYLKVFQWKLLVEMEQEGKCKTLHLITSEYEEDCKRNANHQDSKYEQNPQTKEVAVQTEADYFKPVKIKRFVRGEYVYVKVIDENNELCWVKGVICMITEQKVLIHFSQFKPRWISKTSPDIASSGNFV